MKFKSIICIVLVAILLMSVGCGNRREDSPTTNPATAPLTTSPTRATTLPSGSTTTTVIPTTTTTEIGTLPTIKDTSALTVQKIDIEGLPVTLADGKNMVRISSAGLLNGDAGNPMLLLVTNVGEDDIFSTTIGINAGGKEISFNISYLPKGGSVWANSVEGYTYNETDSFWIREAIVIVSSTSAGVPIDRSYDGILKIYAGEKDGGRGLFVENISGKNIKKILIKYRPISSGAGLFSAPYQVSLNNFEKGAVLFKANSYLHDVYVVDVQITY